MKCRCFRQFFIHIFLGNLGPLKRWKNHQGTAWAAGALRHQGFGLDLCGHGEGFTDVPWLFVHTQNWSWLRSSRVVAWKRAEKNCLVEIRPLFVLLGVVLKALRPVRGISSRKAEVNKQQLQNSLGSVHRYIQGRATYFIRRSHRDTRMEHDGETWKNNMIKLIWNHPPCTSEFCDIFLNARITLVGLGGLCCGCCCVVGRSWKRCSSDSRPWNRSRGSKGCGKSLTWIMIFLWNITIPTFVSRLENKHTHIWQSAWPMVCTIDPSRGVPTWPALLWVNVLYLG